LVVYTIGFSKCEFFTARKSFAKRQKIVKFLVAAAPNLKEVIDVRYTTFFSGCKIKPLEVLKVLKRLKNLQSLSLANDFNWELGRINIFPVLVYKISAQSHFRRLRVPQFELP